MKPALIHLTYWRERQALPQWAERVMQDLTAPKRSAFLTRRRHTISIDTIVNANAGMRQQTTSGDPCAILSIRNPQGADLLDTLQRLTRDRQMPERANRARRILRRIARAS
jgi:hypothetical protein